MKTNLQQLYKTAVEQRELWLGRWQQCQRFALPTNDADNAQLFDSTAADAAEMLAANMFSLLTPPESEWLSLLDGEEAQTALRAHLNDSNFYTTVHQCYMDLVVLGTACLFMVETAIGSKSAFSFSAIPMENISIIRGSDDNITAVFHTAALPAREIAERFPKWTPPANLRQTFIDNPETEIRLIQSVIKNKAWDFTAWLDVGGDLENNIIQIGEFQTCPYIIFRWTAATGESYGRSPVMRALPDIKTANKVVELVLKNATIAVSGIWQADDDGVINLGNINLTPGAIIPKAVGSSGLTPLTSGADFDVSQLILDDLRVRIRRSLLADRISILNEKEMTATEVIARNTDMMRILGATYGRVLNELIKPMVSRGLAILARRGFISECNADIQYHAPISQLAADEKTNNLLTFVDIAAANGLEEFVNKTAFAKYLADALHVPKELLQV